MFYLKHKLVFDMSQNADTSPLCQPYTIFAFRNKAYQAILCKLQRI